jgi:hypothetical protein
LGTCDVSVNSFGAARYILAKGKEAQERKDDTILLVLLVLLVVLSFPRMLYEKTYRWIPG